MLFFVNSMYVASDRIYKKMNASKRESNLSLDITAHL